MTATAERVLALAAALLLAACANDPAREIEPDTPLLWPGAPEVARIAYVKTFRRPEDLGISRHFLQRLADVLFGVPRAGLVRPMAVAAVGNIYYVADPGAKGVHRFDPANGNYDLMRGPRNAPLPSPIGLARGAGGEVYVTDSVLGKVFVLHPGAQAATEVKLATTLGRPTGIAHDSASGRLFVVDTSAHHINVFGRDGRLLRSFGGRGTGDGQFNYPTMLWRANDGRLYVTDSLNFRVQILDPEGTFLAKFGRHGDGTGDLARQKGIGTDRFGHIYVVDSLFHAVQIFDQKGKFLLSLGGIGQDRGEFWLPTGIFISEDDTIYVADSYNRRVQVFRYIGGAK